MITDIQRGRLIQAASFLVSIHTRCARDDTSLVARQLAIDEFHRHVGNMTQLFGAERLGDPVMWATAILMASGEDVDVSLL